MFACEHSCECVCVCVVVVEVVWVVLVEACSDHGGFGFVELFVSFAHESGGGFVDEF